MLLAGDIGGTKTVLALFTAADGPHKPISEARFNSGKYQKLAIIVEEFLSQTGERPVIATFGVAGPVDDEIVRVTNLPWVVDAKELRRVLQIDDVYLINDLEAIAYSIPALDRDDLEIIKKGDRQSDGPIAVIAPGTGLGEAFLFWDGNRYRPIPSEGGHTDFAPATPLELELLKYLQPRLGHVSYERVCSGLGVPNIYDFIRDTKICEEPSWLRGELEVAADPTPIIFRYAREGKAEICEATVSLFLSILGSEAGNLVLQVLATGGVYLGGGIPPRIVPELRGEPFLKAFTGKGRFTDFLMNVPVDVIMNSKAALFGAANHGLIILSKNESLRHET
jgi:glucokinase